VQVLEPIKYQGTRDPNYADLLRQVIADGREHIAYEEEQVWP
jgi:hypothetical protein